MFTRLYRSDIIENSHGIILNSRTKYNIILQHYLTTLSIQYYLKYDYYYIQYATERKALLGECIISEKYVYSEFAIQLLKFSFVKEEENKIKIKKRIN